MATYRTVNNDTGSLKVANSAGSHQWTAGQWIRINGENKRRKVTYVMGKGEKCHLCFKGQGSLPEGDVEYEVVEGPPEIK